MVATTKMVHTMLHITRDGAPDAISNITMLASPQGAKDFEVRDVTDAGSGMWGAATGECDQAV